MMRNFTGSSWLALAGIALLGSAAFVPTGRAAVHSLPLVLPAGNPDLMGFIRIVNRSDRAGEVDITAIDDSGNEAGPITLSIGADSSRHFNSEDLENGNADKEGLSDGVGGGQCSWRLELETDLDILPLAFVRTGDGFVTTIHDVVPEVEPGRHDVAIFNPGKNMTQQSRLRLVNLGEFDAIVDVKGTDDDGIQSEGTVQLTVPKGGACTVTSEELESGETDDSCGCAMSGDGLGAGEGKWQLSVTTEQSIQVMSVLKTPEHLTNLSTVRYGGFAPPDENAFSARFVGRRVRATDGSGYVDFVSSGRFSESDGDGMYEGDYTYENEGPNSGTLVFEYDDGEECTALAAFDSFIAGTTLSVCEDGGVLELQPIRSWVLEDIVLAGMAPADQAAFDALVASQRLAHDDASGLGVAFVFVSPGEFSHGTGASERTGTYAYENTGRSSGTVELTYAGGGMCTLELVFEADDSGRMDYTCVDASDNTTTGSTNWRLEFAGAVGLAPADQDAFSERFRDKRLVSTADTQGSFYYLDFLTRTGFREYEFGDTYEGTYTYVSTGANTADLVLEYDDGDRCDVDITFESPTSGQSEWDCMYAGMNTTGWQAIDRP